MNRNEFLKIGTMAALSPLFVRASETDTPTIDSGLMKRLIAANDKQVALLLESIQEGKLRFSRMIAYDIAVLTASYCAVGSAYYHTPLLIQKLDLLTKFLATAQSEDGTVNVGNLESPPDTAFVIEILCPAAEILKKEKTKDVDAINQQLKRIILKAGEGLVVGGVHTPNHRWVISAALSGINSLYPNKKYIDRINDWLDEGVFIDDDGHYPERSGIYSGVENTAFITIGRLANKKELFEPVRKNLSMYYYYIEPNGDLVTNDSRRQDQYLAAQKPVTLLYLQYRYMAIRDNNKHFAAIAKMIEALPGFEKDILTRSLFYFLENETLQQQLPSAASLPDRYEKVFSTSHLLRIKEKNMTATLFGGVDWPLIIASGRSNSPDFFSYRKGNAILKYMRLSTSFFSMGYFYSEGLKKVGNKYVLHKQLDIPYYQPLPKDKRNKKGDYKLSPSIDDRFWNKMDFKNRPISNVKTLDTTITLSKTGETIELEFEVNGLKEVPVTIELCFAKGGTLTGTTAAENNNNLLEQGTGEYSSGGDVIRFGPGNAAHKMIANLEGERYGTHFGSLRTEGEHVYITGKTPFKHKLTFS
ncbi:hypothetical protein WG954_21135 [Lacibacter sp. H375]|uniref:hypothetical protein n=1 Tax=Lacibacter sp. H375 TaxID=3133424 RepID=UPI0030BEDA5F